jgi:nucleoid-associated protein YgaU
MSMLIKSAAIYPDAKVNADNLVIQQYITISGNLVHNPVRVALKAYNSIENADAIWLVNHIRNPFKELTKGKVLMIPKLTDVSSTTVQLGKTTSIRVKNASINGQTITL